MSPFLEQLANQLYKAHGENLSSLCIVFPNRRAGLFFRQYLSRLITRPVWLPEIIALEDFVILKSKLEIQDPLNLLIRLYQQVQLQGEFKSKSFAEFISWGNMILSDFDEIDQYLADGEKVFTYLDELKALTLWNLDSKPLTSFEKDYLGFYNSLSELYSGFRKSLLEKGEAYFGFAFSELIRNLESESFSEWDKVIFAGFNALTKAEERLIMFLINKGKAEIYWDADEYYLTDTKQEAGTFLRQYSKDKRFGEFKWIGSDLKSDSKEISVIGVPGNVGMAKVAGLTIGQMLKKVPPSEIAVVLVDEGLLIPVLNSLPGEVQHFNVTMGFPLRQTVFYSLFDAFFRLIINSKKFARTVNGKDGTSHIVYRYHMKDLEQIFQHPSVLTEGIQSKPLNGTIEKNRSKTYFEGEEVKAMFYKRLPSFGPLVDNYLPDDPDNIAKVLTFFLEIVEHFRKTAATSSSADINSSLETEFLYQFYLMFNRLKTLLSDTELISGIETFYQIIESLVAGSRLPFYGEPLKGLQLMGMLETRVLDFKHLVMLSVNEGLLPKGKHQSTFIPDEVRRAFGLQRYHERNAVFAYHFYRLLQRSAALTLFYSTEGNELGGGEKSRFLTQIFHELPVYNANIKIKEAIVSIPPGQSMDTIIQISKDEKIMQRLKEKASKGFAPTTLSSYLACSLQFYFSQVMELGEKEEAEETIDAATLGSVIHEVLEKTYRPYVGKRISPDELSKMLPIAVAEVKSAFSELYFENEISSGKNLIVLKVAEGMVKRFIRSEIEFLSNLPKDSQFIEVLKVEDWLKTNLAVPIGEGGEVIEVEVHGKADRIDRVGGIIRVIDYKTGIVKPVEMKLSELELLREHENPSKLLQLLCYAWLYRRMYSNQRDESLVSGIISLRSASRYLNCISIGDKEGMTADLLSGFEMILKQLLTEILDPSRMFIQTENVDTCKNCIYQSICNRVI